MFIFKLQGMVYFVLLKKMGLVLPCEAAASITKLGWRQPGTLIDCFASKSGEAWTNDVALRSERAT